MSQWEGSEVIYGSFHNAIKFFLPFIIYFSEIRYEVNFQNGIECGGAYVKLLSKTPELNLVGTALGAATHPQLADETLRGKQRKFHSTWEGEGLLPCYFKLWEA